MINDIERSLWPLEELVVNVESSVDTEELVEVKRLFGVKGLVEAEINEKADDGVNEKEVGLFIDVVGVVVAGFSVAGFAEVVLVVSGGDKTFIWIPICFSHILFSWYCFEITFSS